MNGIYFGHSKRATELSENRTRTRTKLIQSLLCSLSLPSHDRALRVSRNSSTLPEAAHTLLFYFHSSPDCSGCINIQTTRRSRSHRTRTTVCWSGNHFRAWADLFRVVLRLQKRLPTRTSPQRRKVYRNGSKLVFQSRSSSLPLLGLVSTLESATRTTQLRMETSRVAVTVTVTATATGTTAGPVSTSKTPDWLSAQIHGCSPFTHLLSVTHLALISLALTTRLPDRHRGPYTAHIRCPEQEDMASRRLCSNYPFVDHPPAQPPAADRPIIQMGRLTRPDEERPISPGMARYHYGQRHCVLQRARR